MSSIAVRHQVCHEGQENTQGALRSFLRGRLPQQKTRFFEAENQHQKSKKLKAGRSKAKTVCRDLSFCHGRRLDTAIETVRFAACLCPSECLWQATWRPMPMIKFSLAIGYSW